MQLLRTKKRTNPLFHPDACRLELGEERAERALTDPDSVDLLVWNVFSSLDNHRDRDWLAYRLQLLGGAGITPPVRLSLWTGATQEPLLRPSSAYVSRIKQRVRAVGGDDARLADFLAPIEVPVRIEAPDVLALVDATVATVPRGNGGRDRLIELIDAGIDHAHRLDKRLAVAVVYGSGTDAATELTAHSDTLRDPRTLATALPRRGDVPAVVLRTVTWQQLLRVWEAEVAYLDLAGQPVKGFVEHCRRRGLR